jgi:hypothetical protein
VGRAHLTAAGDKAPAVFVFPSGVPFVALPSNLIAVFLEQVSEGRRCAVLERRSSGPLK